MGSILAKQETLPLAETKKPKVFYGYFVVAAAFGTILVMYGTYYSFGVFFKPVLTEFGWTRAATAAAFSLSSLVRGALYVVRDYSRLAAPSFWVWAIY